MFKYFNSKIFIFHIVFCQLCGRECNWEDRSIGLFNHKPSQHLQTKLVPADHTRHCFSICKPNLAQLILLGIVSAFESQTKFCIVLMVKQNYKTIDFYPALFRTKSYKLALDLKGRKT